MPEETVKAVVWSATGPARDSLYYYRARYYDPTAGRFLSEDPTRIKYDNANYYSYAGNSPVVKFDPTGLATCDYIINEWNGRGWLYCQPDDPRNEGVSFPAASGNNNDPEHKCMNNAACAPKHFIGPIPPGHYTFVGVPGSHKHAGTALQPDDPAAAFNRSGLLIHFCKNPFSQSASPRPCSAGCITATEENIMKLNKLLTIEPHSTLTVYPEPPLI